MTNATPTAAATERVTASSDWLDRLLGAIPLAAIVTWLAAAYCLDCLDVARLNFDTNLDGSELWQIGLLELWLQRHVG